MQIMFADDFDWGHMVSKVEKGVLSTAIEKAKDNLTPDTQPCEVIIYQTAEDELE